MPVAAGRSRAGAASARKPKASGKRGADEDDFEPDESAPGPEARAKKTVAKGTGKGKGASASGAAVSFLELVPLPLEPTRRRPLEHAARYHVPHLLSSIPAQDALLEWFDSVQHTRDMPWRKEWVDPASLTRDEASRRGYEVLVSETMLQQTRVETVRAYYQNWMERFPDVGALAGAEADEVMAAWRGLGYYSRATRLQSAAETIRDKYAGVLPSDPEELQREIAGVGRYTAGAISSIVHGVATPLLDGNVARVLSRQMGLHADVKGKAATDVLWRAAELLVVKVSKAKLGLDSKNDSDGVEGASGPVSSGSGPGTRVKPSATPGRWNQSLMELGASICTPFPRCEMCPIRSSCRAYAEGAALAAATSKKGARKPVALDDDAGADGDGAAVQDIEDLGGSESCMLCEPMSSLAEALSDLSDDEDGASALSGRGASASAKGKKKAKLNEKAASESKLKQSTLSFAPLGPPKKASSSEAETSGRSKASASSKVTPLDPESEKIIQAHVRQFPFKVAKKKVREEDAVVCIIEARRPAVGARSGSASPSKAGKRKARALDECKIQRDSLFLIRQRPDKGLLASMWEMPTHSYSEEDADRTDDDRIKAARAYTLQMIKDVGFPDGTQPANPAKLKMHVEKLGLHTHVFSHLKMHMHTMHVVLELPKLSSDGAEKAAASGSKVKGKAKGGKEGKWVKADALEKDHSMGNGMRTCWAMAAGAAEE